MESLVDYSRQVTFDNTFRDIRGSMREYTHVIVGCGGVGFWLGILLAMQGMDKFILIDGQDVEPSNLNRLPIPVNWNKQKKCVALRKVIRQLRPETAILTQSCHITKEAFGVLGKVIDAPQRSCIVWDCTDDARIQRVAYKWAKEVNITYRKIGYEGFDVGTYTNYDVWTEPDYQPGYRTSNACAATSALAAVIGFMAEGLRLDKDINVNIRSILEHAQEEVPDGQTPQE